MITLLALVHRYETISSTHGLQLAITWVLNWVLANPVVDLSVSLRLSGAPRADRLLPGNSLSSTSLRPVAVANAKSRMSGTQMPEHFRSDEECNQECDDTNAMLEYELLNIDKPYPDRIP